MPPSPNAPRFLEGKKENVAAVPSAPGRASGAARAGRLGGVLEHRDAERLYLGHRSDVAEQVDGDHRLGAGPEHGLHGLGGEAVRVGVDVAEHGCGAGRGDRLDRGVERERGNDHLVAGPHAHRPQRDRDRVGAVGHADGVPAAAVRRELLLERLHLGAEDEAPRVQHPRDGLAQLVAERRQRRGGVEQGDARHRRSRQERPSSSRSACVISRISSSKLVCAFQPRSRSALEASPTRWSTSAGRTNAGSIVT